jgi:hypothetical protein
MAGQIIKSTAVFARPFSLPGFDEMLPAGEYDLETEISAPLDDLDPECWKASVMVQLHARGSHPGLSRSLTVPLSVLDHALARDKLTGSDLVDFFVEEMLADPMVRLVMKADCVSAADIRNIYAQKRPTEPPDFDLGRPAGNVQPPRAEQDRNALHAAENEGMPLRDGKRRRDPGPRRRSAKPL